MLNVTGQHQNMFKYSFNNHSTILLFLWIFRNVENSGHTASTLQSTVLNYVNQNIENIWLEFNFFFLKEGNSVSATIPTRSENACREDGGRKYEDTNTTGIDIKLDFLFIIYTV